MVEQRISSDYQAFDLEQPDTTVPPPTIEEKLTYLKHNTNFQQTEY